MQISTKPSRESWEQFLGGHPGAHAWHSWSWGEFLEAHGGRKVLRFSVSGDQGALCQFSTALIPYSLLGYRAESMPVYHFAGPIFFPGLSNSRRVEALELLLKSVEMELARHKALAHLVFVWDPSSPEAETELWKRFGYDAREDASFIYRMPEDVGEIAKNYRHGFGRQVRFGEKKGGRVELNPAVDPSVICSMYRSTMKHADESPRYDDSEISHILDWDGDRRDLYICRDGKDIAGFAIVLRYGSTAIAWLGGMDRERRSVRPLTMIMHTLLRRAFEQGIRTIDFGGAPTPGIRNFKESIGAERERVMVYDKTLLPLKLSVAGKLKRLGALFQRG